MEDSMQKREINYDFYKALLIIGVTYGHVLTALQGGGGHTFWIHQFIRTYDMPMFAFISGLFLFGSCKKHTIVLNLLRKVGMLLFPAIVWELFFNIIGGEYRISTDRFWFLYSLFIVSEIIIVVDSLCKNNSRMKAFMFSISVIVFHTLVIDKFKTGFLLAPAIVGYYCAEFCVFKTGRNKELLGLLPVVLFIVFQLFWKIDYNVWNTGCDLLRNGELIQNSIKILFRFLIGITGCFSMKWIFDYLLKICRFGMKSNADCFLNKMISLGQCTSELYILQCWLIAIAGTRVVNELTNVLGTNYFITNPFVLVVVIAPMVTIASIIIMYYIQKLIKILPIVGTYAFGISIEKL